MVIAVKSNPQKFMMEKAEFDENKKHTKSENSCDQENLVLGMQQFVGNCKEFRINNNKNHLRIIGNCNKIRLNNNSGHLEVIGNTTRVKIINNSGKISYTGNSGKVYLGRGSSIQHVDYIGNNGILKVVHEDNLNDGCKKRSTEKTPIGKTSSMKINPDECCNNHRNSTKEKPDRSYVKMESRKAPSRSSTEIRIDPNVNGDGLCMHIKNNISMPNLNSINFCTSNHISNSIRVTGSTGNIIVNNSYRL